MIYGVSLQVRAPECYIIKWAIWAPQWRTTSATGNFGNNGSTPRTSWCSEGTVATRSPPLWQRGANGTMTVEGKKSKVSPGFLHRRTPALGLFQLWSDSQLRSHWSQLSIKLLKRRESGSKASMPVRGRQHRATGAKHIKTHTSSSLPEGHKSSACQNPSEFTPSSESHTRTCNPMWYNYKLIMCESNDDSLTVRSSGVLSFPGSQSAASGER